MDLNIVFGSTITFSLEKSLFDKLKCSSDCKNPNVGGSIISPFASKNKDFKDIKFDKELRCEGGIRLKDKFKLSNFQNEFYDINKDEI